MDEVHREERKPELTLDQAVKSMQAAWTKFRDVQLYAFHAAVPTLEIARASPDDFRIYCQDRGVRGDRPETQVAELLIQNDPDADAISRERRGEYGAAIGWFATRTLCPESDPKRAVELARQKGRIQGIAALYRRDRDAANPEAAVTKAKVKATKAANATQAKLRTNAAGTSPDTTPASAEMPGVSESTDPKGFMRRRTELAKEVGRKLDEAGVVSYSLDDLPDSKVSLYLAVHDQPSGRPRLFEVMDEDANYDSLLDTIITRHLKILDNENSQAHLRFCRYTGSKAKLRSQILSCLLPSLGLAQSRSK